MNYIKDNNPTNSDVYKFGLQNGFLPKHTNEILKRWKREGVIEIIAQDGKPVKGSYIEYDSERKVQFTLKSKSV